METEAALLPPAAWPGMAGLTGLLDLGGPVVLLLVGLSIVSLTIILLKLYQFAGAGIWRRHAVQRMIDGLRRDTGKQSAARLAKARDIRNAVLRAALIAARRHGADEARAREEAHRAAANRLESLHSHLRTLEVIAALSPLLGLFGTVIGMIEAFQAMEAAGAQVNPAHLSGGIWQALLTTAVGLAVAMPAVAALAFFERSLDRLAHDLDSLISEVFTGGVPLPAAAANDLMAAGRERQAWHRRQPGDEPRSANVPAAVAAD